MFPIIPAFDTLYATTAAGRPTTPPAPARAPEPDYAALGRQTRDAVLCMRPSEWPRWFELEYTGSPMMRAIAFAIRMIKADIARYMPETYARMMRDNRSPVEVWTAMGDERRLAEWRALPARRREQRLD